MGTRALVSALVIASFAGGAQVRDALDVREAERVRDQRRAKREAERAGRPKRTRLMRDGVILETTTATATPQESQP